MNDFDVILQQSENVYNNGVSFCKIDWLRTILLERGSQEEKRRLPVCHREIATATFIAERCLFANQEKRGIVTDANVCAEKLIESFARKHNFWIDNTDSYFKNKYGESLSFGSESTVYLTFDKKVLKTIDTNCNYETILKGLYRIIIHNALFPETFLDVIGFGRSQFGLFEIIAEQVYIVGRPATYDELDSTLKTIGATNKNGDYFTDKYFISDIKPKNAIVDNAGRVFIIDCYLEFLPDTVNGIFESNI